MKVLSIVVARKGSKGLPSKCMLPIDGKPVVEHVIKWSKSLSKPGMEVTTVVSTDINELEEISKKYNAVFIARPQKLSEDSARIEEAIFHACEYLGEKWDYLSLLYGNIPIRHNELIEEPLLYLEKNTKFDALLSFQAVEKFHPSWMIELNSDLLPVWKEKGYRRQDLVQYMIHDGHTCLTRWSYFMSFWPEREKRKTGQMYESFGKSIKPWLHKKLVIDIDTERDYLLAKAIKEYENN